jgi:hypothetical protein
MPWVVVSHALAGTLGCVAGQVRYATVTPPGVADAPPSAVLYLLGDAGEANTARDAVLASLTRDIQAVAQDGQGPPVLVAFLGDNIYDRGATETPDEADLRKLSEQILAIPRLPNVRAVFLPGNHDWGNGGDHDEGVAALARQREWAASVADGRDIAFLPDDGCAGPATRALGGAARLVFIDTEWLLRGRTDPRCGSPEEAYARLADTLRVGAGRPAILLGHHPLVSGGPHGGNVSMLDWPPVAGYLVAKAGAIRQDLGSRAYTAMRRDVATAIEASGVVPLIQGSGHEHALQIVRMAGDGAPRYQLVSGSASRTSAVTRIDGTRYATGAHGYMRLDLQADGARVVVFALDANPADADDRASGTSAAESTVRAVFACTLTAAEAECPEAPLVGIP